MDTYIGKHYDNGQLICITVLDGVIQSIVPVADKAVIDPDWIAPGLVDLQMNGYAGIDMNQASLQPEQVLQLTEAVWQEGVTSFLPTIITNSAEQIDQLLRVIAKSRRENAAVASCIPGIHLEGPFISPEDGPRGAHQAAYVQAPAWELMERWQRAADGCIRLITLSPEWPDAPSFIEACQRSGVKVAIGHTAASPDQISQAAAAGATLSTHFGNGAHLMLQRHPNYLWEQLAQDSLWATVIADGFHVPGAVLKVVHRVKASKLMLISDAVYLSGLPSGRYQTHIGGDVVLSEDGRLYMHHNPQMLAGSARMLPWGIEHMTAQGICTLSEAWEMASTRPSTYLSLPTCEGLKLGAPADFVFFRKQGGHIQIRKKPGRLSTLQKMRWLHVNMVLIVEDNARAYADTARMFTDV